MKHIVAIILLMLAISSFAATKVSINIKVDQINRLSPIEIAQAPDSASMWVRSIHSSVIEEVKNDEYFARNVLINTPKCYREIFKIRNCDVIPSDDNPIIMQLTGIVSELNPNKVQFKKEGFTCAFTNAPIECKN